MSLIHNPLLDILGTSLDLPRGSIGSDITSYLPRMPMSRTGSFTNTWSSSLPPIDVLRRSVSIGLKRWLSNPIATRPIISNKFFPPIIVTLAYLWGIKFYRQDAKQSRSAYSYIANLAPAIILGRNDCWVAACAYSAFYLTWQSLPEASSSTYKANLPDFDVFVKSLRDWSPPQIVEEGGSTGRDGSDCLVCWSADGVPKELPCKHLICYDCLKSMREHDQHICPYCLRPLFTRNDNLTAEIYKIGSSIWHTELTVRLILLALRIYKQDLRSPAALNDLCMVMMGSFMAFGHWVMVHVDGPDWWRDLDLRPRQSKLLLVATTLLQLPSILQAFGMIARLDVEAVFWGCSTGRSVYSLVIIEHLES